FPYPTLFRSELTSGNEVVDRARDRVVVGAGAQEAGEVVGGGVLGGHAPRMTDEVALGHRGGQGERPGGRGLGGGAWGPRPWGGGGRGAPRRWGRGSAPASPSAARACWRCSAWRLRLSAR